jgi:hypothetical protein
MGMFLIWESFTSAGTHHCVYQLSFTLGTLQVQATSSSALHVVQSQQQMCHSESVRLSMYCNPTLYLYRMDVQWALLGQGLFPICTVVMTVSVCPVDSAPCVRVEDAGYVRLDAGRNPLNQRRRFLAMPVGMLSSARILQRQDVSEAVHAVVVLVMRAKLVKNVLSNFMRMGPSATIAVHPAHSLCKCHC